MKKALAWVLTLALALGAAGCSAPAGEPESTAAPVETPAASGKPQQTQAPEETPGEPEYAETLEADIVVVGAGGGGMAAAIEARQLGADVIVLEKNASYGGTSAYTEGLFAVGSRWQKEAGVEITADEVLQKTMNYHHWIADAELTMTFFEMSGETVQWLEDLGVVFTGARTLGPSLQTWHTYEGLGGQYTKSLYEAATAAGVQFMMETPGQELIMEEGKVAGVAALRADGSRIALKANAVILATGGFADSEEMINEYTSLNFDDVVAVGSPGRTGDGIRMGMEAGAATEGMGTIMLCGALVTSLNFDSQLNVAAGRQPMLWVNEKAERFADEGIVTNFSYSGNAMSRQNKVYNIMDQAILQEMHDNGCFFGKGMYVPTGSPLDDVFNQLDAAIEADDPNIFVADTIEELAGKMGLDPVKLAGTVETYNGYCAAGHDAQYGKAEKYLYPIENGPFYGFSLAKSYYCTVGGLKVNTNIEVLREDESVIPGLYAVGCDAGGLYGDSYDVGIAAGSQEGWAVNSGRLAARSAVAYLGQ